MTTDTEPSVDYLQHTMDSLIQRLVPTDTYIPKVISNRKRKRIE